MGVEKSIIDTNKRVLYRPPALRTKGNEAIKRSTTVNEEMFVTNSSSNELSNTSTLQSTSYPTLSIATTTFMPCIGSATNTNENTNVNNLTTSKQQQTYKTNQKYIKDEQQTQLRQQQQVRRERRPDRAVYIPRARRSQTTPPNTLTSQIQSPSPQQQQALSTLLPAIAPIPSSNTSKSLSQQLAITSNDTISVLVKQKPSAKTDEFGKINTINESTQENFRATITKKKEILSKENKDLQEQKLFKKISAQQIRNSSENCEQSNKEDCLNTIVKNDEIFESHCKNQKVILNDQQKHTSLEINDVNYLSEFNNNFNFCKGFNCDNCKQLNIDQESLDTNSQDLSLLNRYKPKLNESADIDNIDLNDLEISQNISITTNICIPNSNNNKNTMQKTSNKNKTNKINSEVNNSEKRNNLLIEDIQSQKLPAKCDIEEQELQRASKEINRSNRRIIKQTFLSDVLQIPDSIDEERSEGESKVSVVSRTSTSAPTLKEQFDSNTEEEDDWESMYNESGDCLDPKIMEELTASVGKCKIELPKMDYSAYLTKQSILNEEEFPHVLEVSNFPVEFKNQDLLMVFSQYKESGFDIKWVDDTHALAVFSSSRIAAEVLTMGHPFVVLKPLAEATVESRLKAKKCAASLQPYRPRPETCAALARRLVTGALGVRLKTAAAERENEKRVLREAKERKLLAAKQRDEVWES